MAIDFHPYPKSKQLGKHQKEKDTPDFKAKRTYKKKRKPKENKNVQMYHDRIIPHWKQRGKFDTQTVNDILRIWGEWCYVCGSPNYSIHHVYEKGFGKGGRGVVTNGIPLCTVHHTESPTGVHHNRELYEEIRQLFIDAFGPYYYRDKYDLWMMGLITSPTDEQYAKFMRQELEKVKEHAH
jgi:hypothetical protein